MTAPEQTGQTAPRERPRYEMLALAAKQQFLTVCDEKKWNAEIVFALQIIRGNTTLQGVMESNPQSITNAVINIGLTGTTLNPALQLAFLIPRKLRVGDKQVMSCCLDHSYRGLTQIATNSGGVMDMDADCVYPGDFLYYQRGDRPQLVHVPFDQRKPVARLRELYGELGIPVPEEKLAVALTASEKERGKEPTHVYATAKLPDGKGGYYTKFIVLDREEVEKVRKTSQAPESPMWKNWWDEGARKTAIKKLYKLLPQSDRMSIAIAQLNEFEGLDIDADRREGKRSSIMDRFGVDPAKQGADRTVEAEFETVGDDTVKVDICPGEGCGKVRIAGKCHNMACRLGEPAPEV